MQQISQNLSSELPPLKYNNTNKSIEPENSGQYKKFFHPSLAYKQQTTSVLKKTMSLFYSLNRNKQLNQSIVPLPPNKLTLKTTKPNAKKTASFYCAVSEKSQL